MKRLLTTATLAVAALGAALSIGTATAHADPFGCDFTHTCSYDPSYNGPLMPTWDVPGTYGGWTTNPVVCDPVAYTCRQVVVP